MLFWGGSAGHREQPNRAGRARPPRVEQRLRISREQTGTDVSGPVCIHATVRVKPGRVVYVHGETRIAAPRHFTVFLPPFAIVQALFG